MEINCVSQDFSKMILNYLLRGTSTPGSSCYLALYLTPPTRSDIGTEASGGGYQRANISGKFTISNTTGSAWNHETISFVTPTSVLGTVKYWGIRNWYASGSLLISGSFSEAKYIGAGTHIRIKPGHLAFGIAGGDKTVASLGIATSASILKHYLNNTSFTSPGDQVWAYLYGGNMYSGLNRIYLPEKDGSGGRVVSASWGYNRQCVGGTGSWLNPVSGSTVNLQNWLLITNNLTEHQNVPTRLYIDGTYLQTAGSELLLGGIDLFPTPSYINPKDGLIINSGSFKAQIL